MITGMTGFGTSGIFLGKGKGVVEVKTVNHRYLDVAFYLPVGFSSFEGPIQKVIARHIKRGRVTVAVRITGKPQVDVCFNEDAIKRYRDFAKSLARRFGVKDDLSAADIMRMPGVVEAKEVFIEATHMWPSLEKGLIKAIDSVVAMRLREGKALEKDIAGQLAGMGVSMAQIKARIRDLLKIQKKELSGEEFSSYQKSNDINEELARLAHHIDEAKGLLKQKQEAGKKMDFIAQEMQRETNTIGSKVQDKDISAAVIAIKSKIEKIREQANNAE